MECLKIAKFFASTLLDVAQAVHSRPIILEKMKEKKKKTNKSIAFRDNGQKLLQDISLKSTITHHHTLVTTNFFALVVHRFNGMIPFGHALTIAC